MRVYPGRVRRPSRRRELASGGQTVAQSCTKGRNASPCFASGVESRRSYPQHVARLAAYCHVVEKSEGGSAPYGVILFGNGYDGVTVPNSAENQQAFRNELVRARRLVQAVQKGGLMPDVPARSTVCHDCWLGRPRVHRPGITDTHLDGQTAPGTPHER